MVALFLATSMATFVLTVREYRQTSGNASLSLAWASEELKTDFYRFEETLRLRGPPTTQAKAGRVRFDIITSRVRLLAAVDGFASLRESPETRAICGSSSMKSPDWSPRSNSW